MCRERQKISVMLSGFSSRAAEQRHEYVEQVVTSRGTSQALTTGARVPALRASAMFGKVSKCPGLVYSNGLTSLCAPEPHSPNIAHGCCTVLVVHT